MPGQLPRTSSGLAAWRALQDDPASALVALDFDGTLAPIVDDPAAARALPAVAPTLARLSGVVRTVAIVTGRPARTAAEYAGLLATPGLDRLVILGQYGLERWEPAHGEVRSALPTSRVDQARTELPGLLAAAGAADAFVEDKGVAVAVHVRRLPDPHAALERLRGPLSALADRCGLRLEPGRLVLELRPPGVDKGTALRDLVEEISARIVVYAGDDLGDLAAYDAVDGFRREGVHGLLICAASAEVAVLVQRADLVVDGPAGVVEWLTDLARLTTAA